MTVRFYLQHPPEPGGIIEQKLGDPFDYEGEDRFLAAWDRLAAELASIPVAPVRPEFGYRIPESRR